MKKCRFNTIATRMAITIVLAFVLGLAFEAVTGFCLVYFGARPGVRVVVMTSGLYVFSPQHEPVFSFSANANAQTLASKVATALRLVEAIPAPDRRRLLSALSQSDFRFSLRDRPLAGLPDARPQLQRLTAFELDGRPVRVHFAPPGWSEPRNADPNRETLLIETPLNDGHWLVVTAPDLASNLGRLLRLAYVFLPLAAAIGVLSVLAARRLAAPIRRFVRAAEQLGVDTTAPQLVESGPEELRTATRAFNLMQERLRRFVEDRTQMLAAMSHDLRTPLNRMRLRAEFIEDVEQQKKMFADLEAMRTMIDSTLAFVRDDTAREPRRLVDIGVLVEDVCEDAADAGSSVSYSGPREVNIQCRPTAVARAITNLVDNAVKYGGVARVRLLREPGQVLITIQDDGPGIPASEREKVFTPFYRLEQSRNSSTGGVGLGLSAARTIAREHGGDIILNNRDGGGLCARIELPVNRVDDTVP